MKEFLTNKDLLEIWESYDAFYIGNKYGEGTHNEQFKRLHELIHDDDLSHRAFTWIACYYDCYYKDEFKDMDESNPFYYLQTYLNKKEAK